MYDLSYSLANHEEAVAQFLFIRIEVLSGTTIFAGHSKLPQKALIVVSKDITIHVSSYQVQFCFCFIFAKECSFVV